MKTVNIGKIGESAAAKFLKKNHYRVLEMNVHLSHNEIDIVAKDKNHIIFVEVKTRSTDNDLYSYFGSPASAVTFGKQKRTVEAARQYLKNSSHNHLQPRFDVIEVYLDRANNKVLHINHIVNAFGA